MKENLNDNKEDKEDENNNEESNGKIEGRINLEPITRNSFKILAGILTFIIIVIVIILIVQFTSGEENQNIKEITEGLNSTKIRLINWEFGSSEKITLTPEEISKGAQPEIFNKAPPDVYVCTAMGGFSGHTNDYYYEKKLADVNKTQFDVDWYFRSNFELNTTISEEKLILLHINGINYKSDVYIDGNLVAKKENIIGTFVKYTLDITNFLDKSLKKHYVAFKIQRPHNYWNGGNDTDLAISFVDWNPEAPDSNMGVWQPVDVEIFEKKQLTVSSAFIKTEIIEEKRINLEIILHIKNWESRRVESTFSIRLGNFIYFYVKDEVFESLEEKQIILNSETVGDLSIKYDSKKLWWPYQMGEQTMHNLKIKFKDYEFNKQIGLKQVESIYDPVKKIVLYKINNKNILLKGAGWTPDLFLRQSPENYYNHVKYVKDMGLNVIRLEGKSEGEEFYEYCDKLGILVIAGWNCADAWQRWSKWTEDVHKLSDVSVRSQIRKLSPHPSVIIFILGSDYGPTNGVEERWRQIFEEEKWPNQILSSAAASKSSDEYPTGVKMSGPYSWVPPNYFYLQKSRSNGFGGAYGFLTEGGPGENPLRRGSIEKVFNNDNLEKYEGDSWKYHCGNKEVFGDLTKIITPMKERMGDISDFDDFQKKSSAIVYEGHRAMFEAYECYRYESTGVIQWMLNNAWPSNIWHLYDYFMTPTPSYFATKKSTERIHSLYNYGDNSVYLTNNYFSDFNSNINLDIYVISSDGKTISYNKKHTINNLKSDETKMIEQIKDISEDNYILHLEYYYSYNNNNIFSSNTYFLNKNMDNIDFTNPTFYNVKIIDYANMKFMQNIGEAKISHEILSKTDFEENGQKKVRYNFKINNTGDIIALLLEIKLYQKNESSNDIVVPIIWSDNYFSIRGKSSYEITAEFAYDKNKELILDIVGWNCKLNAKLN